MRLLIVEDEKEIVLALQKGLKKDGYAVDICMNGEEALELLSNTVYDLLIVDLNLPGMEGFSIIETLRKTNTTTNIIIISAKREIEDRIKGLDLGANDYLVKPFDFQELKARIRALLRRKFVSTPSMIEEAGLQLDLATRKVCYHDKPLSLTLKEFSILYYLIQHKDRIVSAEELFEHVWDDVADPFSKVIRVHIYSLRKKLLQASGNKEFIETMKGSGYHFRGLSND